MYKIAHTHTHTSEVLTGGQTIVRNRHPSACKPISEASVHGHAIRYYYYYYYYDTRRLSSSTFYPKIYRNLSSARFFFFFYNHLPVSRAHIGGYDRSNFFLIPFIIYCDIVFVIFPTCHCSADVAF